MLRRLALMGVLVTAVAAIQPVMAQQNPLAAPDTSFNGIWRLDSTRGDTLPTALRPRAATQAAPGSQGNAAAAAAAAGQAGRAGAGRGSGRGGGGGGARGGARSGRNSGGSDVLAVDLLTEIAPEALTIKVGDAVTTIANGSAEPFEWETNQKKKLVGIPKGGTFEVEASWWQKVLQTIRTVDKNNELKRDLKQIDGGKSLEVKLSGKVNGKKISLKFYYTRS